MTANKMIEAINYSWLVPLLPLVGFLLIGFFGKKMSKGLVGLIACATVGIGFIFSCGMFGQLFGDQAVGEIFHVGKGNSSYTIHLFNWIHAGNFIADFNFLIDPLSVIFLLIITGVGFLIHVYSIGYMHEDAAFSRFFSYLNLFIFFMLLLVLGDNYLTMFIDRKSVV